jgi:hypothetical protein
MRAGARCPDRRGQRLDVIRAVVPLPVDEEGRRTRDDAQIGGFDVLCDAGGVDVSAQLVTEPVTVESLLLGITEQVIDAQVALPGEQQVVHGPELPLGCGSFGGLGGDLRLRMDVGERQVAPHEANVVVHEQLPHDALGLSAVRTLEISILDHGHRRALRPSDVVALRIHRHDQIDQPFRIAEHRPRASRR